MQVPSSLLVIDLDRTGIFPVRPLALAMGLENGEVVSGLDSALALLGERQTIPHHIVIDLGDNKEEVFPDIERLVGACKGTARIVAVGNTNDLYFYRALKQLGVWEYFNHPVDVSEMVRALKQSALLQRIEVDEPNKGKVISFISAASGDGASTAALNVSYALATAHRASTVLVDMDYQFGMIARHLDLSAQYGIRELFEYPDRGVDSTLLSKMLLPYNNGLKIIAAPNTLRLLPSIRPETVSELISVLRQQFSFVILDMPHLWMPWTAEALIQSDRVVAVAQLWLRSLTHLSRLMGAWSEMGISRENVLLAVNRVGAKYREAVVPQDFERVVLKTINFYLANDIKAVVAADNQGKTVVEIGNTQLERQFYDIARVLYSLSGQVAGLRPYPEDAVRKKGFRAMFSGG